MDTFHMRIFQRQVCDQCRFLLAAARDVNEGLRANDTDRVLYAIQNVLNAGANISKLLWGQRGRHAESRRRLRDSIGIEDDSPFRDVSMRNNFEHIDERIDRWWAQSKRHNHADKIIGPRGLVCGFDEIDTFRWFDPTSKEVIFWGQRFNIQTLVTEAERILPKLEAEATKPHWDRADPP